MKYLRPAFFIIGERKCATSSLYHYLIGHPQVLPCKLKEPQYFSKPWWYRFTHRQWYRALFPEPEARQAAIDWFAQSAGKDLVKQERVFHRDPELPCITGEASANTFAQVPPQRVYHALPGVHLIVCLRHPVDRAHAHYQMLARFAAEGRRIPFRITEFKRDFIDDLARPGGGYFAGLSQYTGRLRAWTEVFGPDRITLVRTEDLPDTTRAKRILNDLCAHLGIGAYDFSQVLMEKENVFGHKPDEDLRRELMTYYTEDIQALESFTGRNFDWT